jgi:translation initiation factor 2B subunit (eIF-2B alpha/beta/delta family)
VINLPTDEFKIDVSHLRQDAINGAVYITIETITAMKNELIRNQNFAEEFEEIIKELRTIHPEMASINNALTNLEMKIAGKKLVQEDIKSHIEKELKVILNRESKVVENLAKELKKYNRIMTISYSSTVFQAIDLLEPNEDIGIIYVMESRPQDEGEAMAHALAERGYNAKIIIDAAAGFFIDDIEVIVMGADTVFLDKSIINKVGSYIVAILAKEHNIPLIVAASTNKITTIDSSKHKELISYQPSKWDHSIDVPVALHEDVIFDYVPAKLITKIITD